MKKRTFITDTKFVLLPMSKLTNITMTFVTINHKTLEHISVKYLNMVHPVEWRNKEISESNPLLLL